MTRTLVLTAILAVLVTFSAAWAGHEGETPGTAPQGRIDLFGTTLNGQPLLGEQHKNAYGFGTHSDSTGRPFSWQGQGDIGPNPLLDVKPNAYGLGQAADQFGRPVRPVRQGLSVPPPVTFIHYYCFGGSTGCRTG
jgi:hypothetical protein